MIVRTQPDGQLLLIAQTDHSKLAGQFAAHWGNERFAALRPYDSVVRAATFHDYGYLRYETAPAFDERSGETPSFRDIPANEQRLEEYQWCFDWLLAGDPYAAYLVSMHRTGLWRGRYDAIRHPGHMIRPLRPEVEAFIARNEARRAETLRASSWDADEIRINYRLLQTWDLLSLYFGCDEPYEEYIEPVPTSYRDRDGEGVRMTLAPRSRTRVGIDPFPFDVDPCRFQLVARRMPKSTFEDAEDFRRAYAQAPLEILEYEVSGVTVTARA